MKMRKQKDKQPITFKKGLLYVIMTLVIIAIPLFIALSLYLYTYEHNHPKYLVNEIVDEYKSKNFDEVLKTTPKEQRKDLKKALNSIVKKDIFSYQSYEDKKKIEYTVVNNNKKLSTIVLEKEKSKALFGIQKVKIKSIEHVPTYQYRIQYFAGSEVYIDGNLAQGEVSNTSTQFANLGYPELQTVTYTLDRYEPITDISATYQGRTCKKYVDSSGMNISMFPSIPKRHSAGIEQMLAQFTQEYARYTTIRGVGMGTVLSHVFPNSALAQLIASYSNAWGEVSLSESFDEIYLTNPIQYYDQVFSYDVHLVFHIVADNGEKKEFPIDYRMYVTDMLGVYQVFDMQRISKESKPAPKANDDATAMHATLEVENRPLDAVGTDGDVSTYYTFAKGETLNVKSEENIGAIYIKWGKAPTAYEVSYNEKTSKKGQNAFLHEVIKIKGNAKNIQFQQLEGNEIAEISVYTKGKLPSDVQDWTKPYKKSDILAFPTHSDDDTLYMGALLSEYAAKGKKIQLAFLTNSDNESTTKNARIRQHELLDGMWTMGLKAYPVVGSFQDHASRSLEHARSLYNSDEILLYQVRNIRRFQPDIVIGHDEHGEYGHGVHMLNTQLLKEAIHLSNDKTFDEESLKTYGAYAPKKTYLHLYAQNQIVLDVHKKMDELQGLSPFEVASNAYKMHKSQHQYELAVEDFGSGDCRLFGLYESSVGYTFETNDLFEGI